MKALKTLSFLGFGIGLVFTSCTVEKRVATRGYHIEWKKNNKFVKPEVEEREQVAVVNEEKAPVRTEEAAVETYAYATQTSTVATPDAAVVTEATETIAAPAAAKAQTKAAGTVAEKKATESKASAISKAEVKKAVKEMKKQSRGTDVPKGLLYVLCFFIPWLAVGLVTDWDVKTVVINLLWTLLCGIPGIIHAIIVVSREY